MTETTTIQPIADTKRTAIVDILRGWAILGVVLGNYSDYGGFGHTVKHAPDMVSNILSTINYIFFAAKSWTLLSVLFGYGFAIVMTNVAAKGKNPIVFFLWRMFWLFVIAFINSSFWFGDILKDYAFLGLILLLFYKASAKTAFYSGLFLVIAVPFVSKLVSVMPYDYGKASEPLMAFYYSHNWWDVFWANLKGTYVLEVILPQYAISVHVMMLACMLLGFAAQRINFFNRLGEFKKQLKRIFWISLAVAVFFNVVFNMLLPAKFITSVINVMYPRYWNVFATMLMIASGICWLYLNSKLKAFFGGLQAMGKMTLTNYMAQNVLAVFLFLNVGLGLFNTQPMWVYFAIAVSVFAIQIPLSKWWLKYYNYGPIEWIWRQLTYMQRLPIRKR